MAGLPENSYSSSNYISRSLTPSAYSNHGIVERSESRSPVPMLPSNGQNPGYSYSGSQGNYVGMSYAVPHYEVGHPNGFHLLAPASSSAIGLKTRGGIPPPPSVGDTRTQLYVGNLPFRVRWQDLKDLMRKCGTVLRADVALTPMDGRSRGFGVVLFARREDALSAIERYNGYTWQTRVLDVRLDTQDPTGVLAIAEASRQQQQQAQIQQQQHQALGMGWSSMSMPINPMYQVRQPSDVPSLADSSFAAHRSISPRAFGGINSSSSVPGSSDGVNDRITTSSNMGNHFDMSDSASAISYDLSWESYNRSNGQNYMNYGPSTSPPGVPQSLPPGHVSRQLFVGNLPFNCQWQELKDLMRSAGAVQRADIAQGTDGRSRGFGSVVFANTADAERAVQLFNGYDYNGRALKVHFDKFTTSPVGMQATPLHMPAMENSMPFIPPAMLDDGYPASRFGMYQPADGVFSRVIQEDIPTPPASHEASKDSASAPTTDVGSSQVPGKNPAAPSRITIPPPYAFGGPVSPLQGRLPPMTPSMPAFTFGQYPQTPPVYPQYFSPGLAPFSPIGSSSSFFSQSPSTFINPAPGAPVHHSEYSVPKIKTSTSSADKSGYFPTLPFPTVDDNKEKSTEELIDGIISLDLKEDPPGPWDTPTQASATLTVKPVENGEEVPYRRRSFNPSGTTERTLALDLRKKFEGDIDRERRASFEDSTSRRPAFGSSIWS